MLQAFLVIIILKTKVYGDSLPTISIIIDDIGNTQILGYRTARLSPEVAISVLPHTPYSQQIAIFAHQRGMEILLHQPMESLDNVDLLGPGALLGTMDRQQFAQTLENNFKAIPFVIGINNHMGSALTTDPEKMNWLMAELKPRAMFFIDSRTTTDTVAAKTAEYWQVPFVSRMVFLDHLDEPQAIDEQFKRLIKLARKHGHATAIGHPRENTLHYLEQNLPLLKRQGIRLIAPSMVIKSILSNDFEDSQIAKKSVPLYFYDSCYSNDIGNNFNKLQSQTQYYSYQCLWTN